MATIAIPQQISDILQYIQNGGGMPREWYVGIASDPRKRLFSDHNVLESGGSGWIYRNFTNHEAARDAEAYLLSKGFAGGTGGGDYTTKSLYAYKITSTTRE